MESKSYSCILIFVIVGILLISTVSAALVPGVNRTALLNSALADMKCKATFETEYMNAIIALFPSLSSSLNPRIDALQLDVSQLSQYASQEDPRSYNIYVQETFTQHLKQNAAAVRAGLDSLKSNATGMSKNETKASLRSLKSTYFSLLDAKESCFSMKDHANLVINYYNNTLNMYQLRAQNLTDRGINASNLLDLVDSARSQILVPLQNGVSSTTNSSQLRIVLHQYCLYDGCANGTNFHMAAKFETMRVTDLLAVISPEATNAGLSSNITAVQTSLNAASTEVNSWGTNDVSPDQLKAAWVDIRSAAKGLHDIFIALGGSAETS